VVTTIHGIVESIGSGALHIVIDRDTTHYPEVGTPVRIELDLAEPERK
jgi:hypothetical protein